ncbi:sensor histidine kinase [Cryptosporangium japonicum]
MGLLIPVAVLAGEVLTVVARHGVTPAAAAYVVAAGLTLLVSRRYPAAAFGCALVVAAVGHVGFVLLLLTAFRAGRSERASVVTVGAAVGGLAVPVTAAAADPGSASSSVTSYLVFVVLPLVAGRYLRQHARLVAALAERNRELAQAQELRAASERLRERLRIAREMHDALGHRLALMSVQAGALEVSDLPPAQRSGVQRLAGSARETLDDLHAVVGALRQGDEIDGPGLDALDALVDEWVSAGVPVTVHRSRRGATLTRAVDRAAYRVVEEGVTNAARHAPASPVVVTLDEEPDTLLVTITNPRPPGPGSSGAAAAGERRAGGNGLAGLRERVEALGGYVSLVRDESTARLVALLPTVTEPPPPPVGTESARHRRLTVAFGAATAVLLFGVLPAAMLLGVG